MDLDAEFTPYGAIHEAGVADSPQIIAHQLGHYLGLDHVDDTSNVLNPVIYPRSTRLSADQCQTAHAPPASPLKGRAHLFGVTSE